MAVPLLKLFLVAAFVGMACEAEITLEHLYTEYIPMSYNPMTFQYNVAAAEQCAIDPNQHVVYVAGLGNLHVYDFSVPTEVNYLTHYTYDEYRGEMTDVETCGTWVVSGFDNQERPREGKVFIFKTYQGRPLEVLHIITVGALPDMVKFTSNCRKVVVAIEGELTVDPQTGEVFDPEGEVVIIEFDRSPDDNNYNLHRADFRGYNDREEELVASGVRKVYNGQGTSFTTTLAQDLEPEYIAISDDDRTAYVVLQENNALAVVNLITHRVTDIFSFGQVTWNNGQSRMDPSDRDGRINLANWPISGIMQPDGVKLITIQGTKYLITADEGDIKEYESPKFPFDWSEAQRGRRFETAEIDQDYVPSYLVSALGDNNRLGRLDFSTIDGLYNGRYREFVSYGARSFSMYKVERNSISLHYNSGGELEQKFSERHPSIFNSNPNSNRDSPEETFDGRSDNRGPEPEAVETGEVNGRTVIFIGMERPGMIALYSLNGDQPEFESMHYHGGFGPRSWEELWADRDSWDTDPEDIKFVPASRSPTGRAMIVVTATYSGTVSFYNVIDTSPFHAAKVGNNSKTADAGDVYPSVDIDAKSIEEIGVRVPETEKAVENKVDPENEEKINRPDVDNKQSGVSDKVKALRKKLRAPQKPSE